MRIAVAGRGPLPDWSREDLAGVQEDDAESSSDAELSNHGYSGSPGPQSWNMTLFQIVKGDRNIHVKGKGKVTCHCTRKLSKQLIMHVNDP